MACLRIFGGFRAFRRTFAGLVLGFVVGCAPAEGSIGALLGQRPDGRLFVRDVPPLLAASKGGLAEGDEILLVDGKDVRSLDPEALHRALSGEIGESVRLTVVRGDAVHRVTLIRTPALPAARAPQ